VVTRYLDRWSVRTIALGLFGLILAVALSVNQGRHQQIGHDFHVFWQSGRNFATGDPLYHGYLPGARQFKYPPFAAFVFQALAVLPLQLAAILFSLLNLILWVVAVYLTSDIVRRTFPDRNRSALALVFAVAFSAQFFLDNFHHVQTNGLILVLVLLGIRAFLDEKDIPAAAYIVTATAIKLTPIFFAIWLCMRGRRRAALAVVAVALGCLLVPLLLRGPSTGAAELAEYHHSFLRGHQRAQIATYRAGQNLAALVNRMSLPAQAGQQISYRYFPLSEPTAGLLYRVLWMTVLLIFLVKLFLLRRERAPVSAWELSMVFLAALLLSPITFTTHLVSLLLVFHTFLSVRPGRLSRAGQIAAAVLVPAMVLTGLSGRDVVGRSVYLYTRGYSLLTWTILLLFLATVLLAGGKPSPRRVEAGEPGSFR
jgi:glycosyl transferase family 87